MPVTPLLLPPSSLHNKINPFFCFSFLFFQFCDEAPSSGVRSSKVYLAKSGDIQNI
jgi:hypothetical protein